jgi:hypothetical protein
VFKAIHPHILHQDVQAVHKGPCRGVPVLLRCARGSDRPLLPTAGLRAKGNAKSKAMHITEVMGRTPSELG